MLIFDVLSRLRKIEARPGMLGLKLIWQQSADEFFVKEQ